jgi:hypothetical protein
MGVIVKIPFGLLLATALFATGEVPGAGTLGLLAQGGAVGVLGWVAYMLFGELKENRRERTDNTAKLAEAIDNLRVHCSAVQAAAKDE